MNMTDDLRIRATRTDRWIGFSRAKFALERLQFLCDHPPSTRPPGLAIYAHSGMGKTMLVEKFRRTNPPTIDTIAGVETVPVLSISLSSKPSERRIYAQLLSSSGASLRHAMTLVEMEVRALSILKQLKVRVIVIDEVHNLLAGSPREQRVILQLFRHLSNELKASLVFLGIADAREAIAGDTQLSRRLTISKSSACSMSSPWNRFDPERSKSPTRMSRAGSPPLNERPSSPDLRFSVSIETRARFQSQLKPKIPGEPSSPTFKPKSTTGIIGARVQSNLGFRVPGKIVERLVDAGQQVKAGQPLMQIDETDLRLALTAKRNAVAAARASVRSGGRGRAAIRQFGQQRMGFPTALRAGESRAGYGHGATRRRRSRRTGRGERGDLFHPGCGRRWHCGRNAWRAGTGRLRRANRGSACPGRPAKRWLRFPRRSGRRSARWPRPACMGAMDAATRHTCGSYRIRHGQAMPF